MSLLGKAGPAILCEVCRATAISCENLCGGPHCQRETKVIDRLYGRYHSRVAFVAVSGSNTMMDGSSDSSELDVLDWIKKLTVGYPVAYDPLLNVADLYMQGGFPTLAVIGANKKIAYLDDGEIEYADLDAAIRKALREQRRFDVSVGVIPRAPRP